MLRVAVDARVRTGGVGRYAATLLSGFESEPLVVDALSDAGWRTASFSPWGRRAVRGFVRAKRPDIFHSFHLELPPGLDVPALVTVHDVIPLTHPASMPSAWKRRIFGRVLHDSLQRAHAVICPSDLTRSDLVARGADASRLHVIPNGSGPGFSPLSSSEAIDARRRFAGGRPYVATLSNPRAHKNVRIIGPVARAVEDGSMTLVSVGSPSEASVTIPHLEDPDLRLFLGGAELFLLTSLLEGFGYPVLESLACGTAVVCGERVGAVAHLSGGIETTDVADPEEVSRVVVGLLRDGSRREELAAQGLEAAGALEAVSMVTATTELYRAVLQP